MLPPAFLRCVEMDTPETIGTAPWSVPAAVRSSPVLRRPPPIMSSGKALPVLDRRSRPLRDLRISVTDRCNFRCSYCMPREVFDKHHEFLPHAALLSFEEIARVAALFVSHGGHKPRRPGGEPLLRKDLEKLVAMLAALRTVDGTLLDLTLTTNGSVLAR